MSESGEENKNEQKGSNTADDDEFGFYLQFTKPLVLDLPEPEDRSIAAAWVRKLEEGPDSDEQKQLRINYLKLLLFVLQRGRLGGIFRKQPPAGPLQSFPAGFSVFDMGNLILDQDDLQPSGGGDGRGVNYNIEISNDLREFIASQEIPNFGIQMYYAWSADDPIHKWAMFDEDKFPQYVLEKIKLIKELQSDEKRGSGKKIDVMKKKMCDISTLEKCPKKRVKSPQEIEKSQGRSFHTYMGLVGRTGNFGEKCDGDPERYQRPQQGRGNCARRVAQGPGPRRGPNQGENGNDDGFNNFMPGLSDLVNAQSRPCLCPYPCHHSECPEHHSARGGQQQEPVVKQIGINVSRHFCNTDLPAGNTFTAAKGPAPSRFSSITDPRIPSIAAPSVQSRRSASPAPRPNCPSRTRFEPQGTQGFGPQGPQGPQGFGPQGFQGFQGPQGPQDFYGGQNFNQTQFCTCPCPRLPQMGMMGGMGGMGMGGMGMGGMGMGGMGMGGMGMGGMGMGMGGMDGMAGPSGLGGAGGQQRSRMPCPDTSRISANYITPQNNYYQPYQAAGQGATRPIATRSKTDVVHCYDGQTVDASFTHTVQKLVNDGAGPSQADLTPVVEESTYYSQICPTDESPEDYVKRDQRAALLEAARANRITLPAKKSLFHSGGQKSFQSSCPGGGTVTKSQPTAGPCPTIDGRSTGGLSSTPENVMSSDRSTTPELLQQSSSPLPQQETQPCPPKQQNYEQDYPVASTRVLSNKPKRGGIFAANNGPGNLANLPGVLQNLKHATETYRPGRADNREQYRPEPYLMGQTTSSFDFTYDFTNFPDQPAARPTTYYTPQRRRRNLVTSPCPERDIASLPDRMSGMGIFNPMQIPTEAQPPPTTPPDSAFIDYTRYPGEESFLYGTEESSYYYQERAQTCDEDNETLSPNSFHFPRNKPREKSPVSSERTPEFRKGDNVRFEEPVCERPAINSSTIQQNISNQEDHCEIEWEEPTRYEFIQIYGERSNGSQRNAASWNQNYFETIDDEVPENENC